MRCSEPAELVVVRRLTRSHLNASTPVPKQKAKRLLKRTAIAAALVVVAFVFGPAAIRGVYTATTNKPDIEALKQRYWMLAAAESPQQMVVADWLEMRGVSPDPGIRDEAVEHASLPIYLFGVTVWQWQDLFRYWSRPSEQRTPQSLLSDASSH